MSRDTGAVKRYAVTYIAASKQLIVAAASLWNLQCQCRTLASCKTHACPPVFYGARHLYGGNFLPKYSSSLARRFFRQDWRFTTM